MTAQLRSELLKQRTTTTILWLLLTMIGLIVLVVVLHASTIPTGDIAGRGAQLRVLGYGTAIGGLIASLVGAMSITGEIRHGTIRPTLLATPRRSLVIVAKVAASAAVGFVLGVIAEAVAAAAEAIGLGARGIHITLGGGDCAQLLLGGGVAAALWAAIGVGVGAIVRNQVGVVVGLCVWVLFVETILVESLPSTGRYLPGGGAGALAGASQEVTTANLLAPVLGALLLLGYALVAATAGSITTQRRDIA